LKTDNEIYKITSEILNAMNNKLLKQKGAYYLGIKLLNNFALEIKNVAGSQKKFKIALKKLLYTHSFYTMEEYLSKS